MKHLPFAFAMLALAAAIAAIWRPDYGWQSGTTAFLFLLASCVAGAINSMRQEQK